MILKDGAPKAYAVVFQYRQRYQEGYNYIIMTHWKNSSSFQYRQRYQEGYNFTYSAPELLNAGFNTDNGIRRATIPQIAKILSE